MTTPLTKADRLAIGAAVAPSVRRGADRPRKVTVVDKDGRPVRETTHVEVARAVLARSEIEFSVQDGKRPEWVTCKTCGAPVKVGKTGSVLRVCRPGAHRCQCGNPVKSKPSVCGYGRLCRACDRSKRIRASNQRRRTFTDEQLRDAVDASATYHAAADSLGVSLTAVYERAKRLGIKPTAKAAA